MHHLQHMHHLPATHLPHLTSQDGTVKLHESVALLCLYVGYLLVVFLSPRVCMHAPPTCNTLTYLLVLCLYVGYLLAEGAPLLPHHDCGFTCNTCNTCNT